MVSPTSSSPKNLRTFASLFGDIVTVNVSLFFAFLIASNLKWQLGFNDYLLRIALPCTLFTVLFLQLRGVYRINARYIGLYDFLNIALLSLVSGLFLLVLTLSTSRVSTDVACAVLFTFFLASGLTLPRIVQRLYNWRNNPFRLVPFSKQRLRVMIVGAGDAGEMMIRELSKANSGRRAVCCLVDDDPRKRNLIIQGVRVVGKVEDIPSLVLKLKIVEIIVAVPSASGLEMRRIIAECAKTDCITRTLPSVSKLLNGVNLQTHLRQVDIEDLLGREPATVDDAAIAEFVSGESILITGGGGSIGSELARQVSRLNPSNLLLIGKGENSLYDIEQELIQTSHFEARVSVVDIGDQSSLNRIFERHMPSVVFHAAAHKHVPLMEANPIEAIQNNIFGTLNVAHTAMKNRAKRFVYISTDKAVRPSSVMGATKRVGEMIITSLAQQSETNFAIVRFGNVLGSRGSLIPLLKQQIARGGPVRITHPDMTRYFMTIPEAVQLILQAGSSGSTGQLFILDMGEPVKIIDIATDLIRLHGLEPHKDIELKFIGTRPGEKITEELVYSEEELQATSHPKIQMASGLVHEWSWLNSQLKILDDICKSGDQELAKQLLMELAWERNTLGLTKSTNATNSSNNAVVNLADHAVQPTN